MATSTDEETLERLLSQCGSHLDAAGLHDLIAGVAAAPRTFATDDWMTLVAERPGDDLVPVLRDLIARARADDFGLIGDPAGPDRISALRTELAKRELQGFVVPRCDEHLGEYVPARAERLAWLTGFDGSAGQAIVFEDKAVLFVDGRYTLQAANQTDPSLFDIRHMIEQPVTDWIAENAQDGDRLGYDPWLHTPDQVTRLDKACRKSGATLIAVDDNPIDTVWTEQPPPPLSPAVAFSDGLAGKPSSEKRAEIAEVLAESGCEATVSAAPDTIAWLLNVRGADIPYTPFCLSFLIITAEGDITWFVDARKLTGEVRRHLGNGVTVREPEALGPALDQLGTDGARVLISPDNTPAWISRRLTESGGQVHRGDDPCQLPKARKNPVELDGMRAAHRRDGAAVSRFLAWLETSATGGGVTELGAADKLESFRRDGERIRNLSFATISGAGPNGAIVHYRSTEKTDRTLAPGSLYLVDSGGQYLDGTTDITRTVAIGAPKDEMRRAFTRVLKGHIALASVRFPKGTTGSQLDVLARQHLWAAGLDYDHGTGHGVGSYLSVHEGPHRITKTGNRTALEPGMVVSNEPGYYREGAFGIRIENLVAVVEAPPPDGAERELLEFETLTLAPIDRALVVPDLMTPEEIAWLNAYHARVREVVVPQVDPETATWLEKATAPIGGA